MLLPRCNLIQLALLLANLSIEASASLSKFDPFQ
jgi:hypothetical protein